MSHMSEDEVDEDYKFFLLTYDPHIDVVCDGGVDGSDDDINIGHNSDHNDHLYREEESLNNNPKLDKGSKQRGETENERNKRSGSVGKQTSGSMKANSWLIISEAQKRKKDKTERIEKHTLKSRLLKIDSMAQWIRRWSTEPEILGSIPSGVACIFLLLFFKRLIF